LLAFRTMRAGLCAVFLGLSLGPAAKPAAATDWPKSDIQPDPAVTFGVLPNGMRYAIEHNATPTGEVSVRLRMATGSLQEAPDQLGLAHFLEHMAFRGSVHVADQETEKTLARLGLRFGSDTNAETQQEQTVFQFDLPRSDDATVDTALMLTREVAGNLTLDASAAKTEAGVVLSELKLDDLPSYHAGKAQLEFLLKDQHAIQLPIGDANIIAAAPIDRIRDYYKSYYRPDRATLVVVGDIDVAKMQAKINAQFADWKNPAPAGTNPHINISRSRGLEVKTFAEAGARNSISVTWLQPPEKRPSNTAQEKAQLIKQVGLQILGRRFQAASSSAARPFMRAGASFDQELEAVRIATLTVGYEPGKWQSALAAAEKIRVGTLQDGVTQDEVDRAIVELRKGFQDLADSAATRQTRAIVSSILDEISENEVYTSAARDLATFNTDVNGLTARTVTQALRDIFQGGGPLIFVSGEKPVDGGEDAVKAAFLEAEKAAHEAPREAVQSAAQAWPYTNFGTPGTVASREDVVDLGASYVRFANGVRLTVRPSKLHANQVQVSVKLSGGLLALPRDHDTVSWATGALVPGGLNALTYIDMQRVLAGKNFSVGFGSGEDGFTFSGGTTPADLDTQMQVLAAYVREPGFRPEAFENYRSNYLQRLSQSSTNPSAVMQLKVPEILHDGDKRWASPDASEVSSATVDDLRGLLTPILANAPIDVTIVGDITTERAIQAVAATFGAFAPRSGPRAEPDGANETHFPAGGKPMQTIATQGPPGQEIAMMTWPTHGRFPDIRDDVTIQMLCAIMEERLFTRLRGLGTVYVAEVGGGSSKIFDYGTIQAVTQLPPDQVQQFHDALNDIIADVIAGKISDDDLARARNPALEELRKTRETNSYWLSVLDDTQENPRKLALARDYEAVLEKVTAADISAAASKYLVASKAVSLAVGH
jgi:zinc protease